MQIKFRLFKHFLIMDRQGTITQRVKFLIKYIIGQGIATNQEDLGRKIGINNKSQMSQLVTNYIPNNNFIDSLLILAPKFNKLWLYDESIESPFLDIPEEKNEKKETNLEKVIKELEANIQLLQKDVRYYSDIADSRLQTINVQNKLINSYENQLKK